jgi:hypothetical protein
MKTFLTKIEVATMITNQYPCPEDVKRKVGVKLSRLPEPYFQAEVLKAGFKVTNFGYNRFYIN